MSYFSIGLNRRCNQRRIDLLHNGRDYADHGIYAVLDTDFGFHDDDDQSDCRGFRLLDQFCRFGHVHHQPARRGNADIFTGSGLLYFDAECDAL